MNDLTRELLAFLAVSSVYLAVLGSGTFLLLRLGRVPAKSACRLCALLLAVPVVLPVQWLLPEARPEGATRAEEMAAFLRAPVDPAPKWPLEGSDPLSLGAAASTEPALSSTSLDPVSTWREQFVAAVERWRSMLLVAWAIACSRLLWREAWGFARLRRILAGATPITDRGTLAELVRAAGVLGLDPPPRLVVTPRVDISLAVGGGPGTVVLPEAFDQSDRDDLHFVLLHELTHLRRRDDRWLPWLRFLRCLYFFHPAVHWAVRKLREEREVLCDLEVVRALGERAPYAEFLMKILSGEHRGLRPDCAMSLFSRQSSASGQMHRVLESTDGAPPSWRGISAKTRARFRELAVSGLLEDQRTDGSWPNEIGPGPAFATAVAISVLAREPN